MRYTLRQAPRESRPNCARSAPRVRINEECPLIGDVV
jgi:hypothetical protein